MRRIAVLLASVLVSAAGMSAASAHAELVSMTPISGSVVSGPLTQLVLTYSEDISGMGSSVVVLDPDDNPVQFTVTFTGPNAVVDLIPFTVTGEYHVNYRINAADGHIIEGSETFTYDGAVQTPTAEPSVIATLASGEEEGEGGFGMGIGLIALIVIGGIVYALTQRKRT